MTMACKGMKLENIPSAIVRTHQNFVAKNRAAIVVCDDTAIYCRKVMSDILGDRSLNDKSPIPG